MDIYNYNKSFFSYLLFQHFSFYWEMVETDREHGIIEGHVIKVPGWNWTHDKATFYICFQSSTSLFSCHCHLTSSEAVCLLTLALTPLTFVLSHRYSPSVQSYGLKAISQTSPTGPIRKPLWPHLGLTDYGGGCPAVQSASGFWVTSDMGCSETQRLQWTHPCHQSVLS